MSKETIPTRVRSIWRLFCLTWVSTGYRIRRLKTVSWIQIISGWCKFDKTILSRLAPYCESKNENDVKDNMILMYLVVQSFMWFKTVYVRLAVLHTLILIDPTHKKSSLINSRSFIASTSPSLSLWHFTNEKTTPSFRMKLGQYFTQQFVVDWTSIVQIWP